MANFNKVILMGNLTRDPELKTLQGGNSVCNLGLAVNRTWRDQQGNKQEEVTFIDVVVWGKTAENCNQYLSKGRPVFIEGRLQMDQWEDRETGQRRSKLKVVAERVQFMGGRDDNQGGGNQGGYRESGGGGYGGGGQQQSGGGYSQHRNDQYDGIDYDDIPF